MKGVIILILSFAIIPPCQSQALKTIFQWDTTGMGSFKGYGEMFIKGTLIKGEPTAIIGGRGGFILNRKIAFGGVGSGYLISSIVGNYAGNPNANLDVKMSSGGVFMEYIHNMESAVHFSVPISFTIGNVEVIEAAGGNRIESSRILMIEPGFNIEFNFSKFLIIAVTGSYRISQINNLVYLRNRDVSGFVIGLVGKFASF